MTELVVPGLKAMVDLTQRDYNMSQIIRGEDIYRVEIYLSGNVCLTRRSSEGWTNIMVFRCERSETSHDYYFDNFWFAFAWFNRLKQTGIPDTRQVAQLASAIGS